MTTFWETLSVFMYNFTMISRPDVLNKYTNSYTADSRLE